MVDTNLSVAVGKSGAVTSPTSASDFQLMDPVFIMPATVAVAPVAPVASVNTIVIGGSSGGMDMNSAVGSSPVTTTVIQEQTIASPYN